MNFKLQQRNNKKTEVKRNTKYNLNQLVFAFVRIRFDVEDLDAAYVPYQPCESVAVCKESQIEVEVVVAPVALAIGTTTEPAVAVVVQAGSENPFVTLPHMNITTITSLF